MRSSSERQECDSNDYWVKQELVFREYERSLDLELALAIVPMTDDDRARMEVDEELAARIFVLDCKNKAEMVEQLRDLAKNAYSEGVRLSALRELGKTYYPKRFRDEVFGSRMERTIRYQVVEPDAEDTKTEDQAVRVNSKD